MFYFVFSNMYHRKPYSNKKYIYRNQFNHAIIRKSIGKKWKLFGYGTHDLHKKLSKCNTITYFNGHIVEIENPEHAIWVKLNYENICNEKWDIKLEGIYKDIDMDQLDNILSEISKLKNIKSGFLKISGSIFNLNRNMKTDFTSSMINQLAESDKNISDMLDFILSFKSSIEQYDQYISKSIKNINSSIDLKTNELLEFINSFKL